MEQRYIESKSKPRILSLNQNKTIKNENVVGIIMERENLGESGTGNPLRTLTFED